MIEDYRRGNLDFEYKFDEHAKWEGCMRTIQHAFSEGFTCFKFTLKIKGRTFQDGFALRPEIHDEKAAVEMAHEMWMKFENTVEMVLDPAGYAQKMATFNAQIEGPAQ